MRGKKARQIPTEIRDSPELAMHILQKKIVGVEDGYNSGYRTNLRIGFDDGTYLDLSACGCCGGITIKTDMDESVSQTRERERIERLRQEVAEEDARNKELGII